MPENMSISVNGQSQVPPGFRFHPTEEELLQYYLKKKVAFERIDLDVIRDVDLNKLEPWDIQEKCKIGSTPQNDWYFFSHKDKKYPTGTRTNRATAVGFWKATGRDKVIHSNGRRIGMRKTLVFYKGRAPHGQKSDWIMHEYRLDDNTTDTSLVSTGTGEATQEEGWVVCRIFKKKNFNKTLTSTMAEETRSLIMLNSCNEGSLEQILETHMGRTWKEENEANNNILYYDGFTRLPTLESPNSTSCRNCYQPIHAEDQEASLTNHVNYEMGTSLTNWAALDRLVASQLNGQTETSRQLNCFNVEPNMVYDTPTGTDHILQIPQLQHNISEWELWNFTRSSS